MAPGQKRWTWGQRFAFLACLAFALVGAIPMAFGALVRAPFVRTWAAKETSRILREQFRVDATYSVEVKPWPLSLSLHDIVVASTDGQGPFATVERASVRPGFFALLGGRLDVGDVELTGAKVRAVVRDGQLQNFAFEAPKGGGESKGPPEIPLASVSITDADVDLDLDGAFIAAREVDVDLAKAQGGLEASLRVGGGEILRRRAVVGHPSEEAVDEDTLCQFEAKARLEPGSILVRRLALNASVDMDPDPGTRPGCDLAEDDWRRVDVQLAGTRVSFDPEKGLREASGRVHLLLPVAVAHRFVEIPEASGVVRVDAQVSFTAGDKLPTVHGDLSVEDCGLDGKMFAKHLDGKIAVSDDTVVLSDANAIWANGHFHIAAVTVWPFEKGIPLEAREVTGEDANLQGILRDLGAHPQAHVGWTLSKTTVPKFGGTLIPLALEGKLNVKTKDFGIYDRSANKADRRRMISVSEATIDGSLVIHPTEVELRSMHAVTPRSNLTASVHLGFNDEFGLEVAPGSKVDLGEISPLAAVPIGGEVTLAAQGTGTNTHPVITGNISVKGFAIGGFDAGDIVAAKATFTPIVLDLSQLELRKGASDILSSKTRVDFQSGAEVLVDADVDTNTKEGLSIKDFFEVFHFTGDPRFASVNGVSRGKAVIHYVVGGLEDKCGGGAVRVRLVSGFDHPELFGEKFESGNVDVNVDWDDRDASSDGMNVDVYSATLADGGGSVMAQAQVRHGGAVRGNVVVSGFPLSRFESMGSLGKVAEGEASAIGTIGGTLERMSANLDVTLTPIRLGAETLPASHFSVAMEPDPTAPERVGVSHCQNPIGAPFRMTEYEKDLKDGQYRFNGSLFEGQVQLSDLTMTRQRAEVVAGNIILANLDLGKLANLSPSVSLANAPPEGKMSAKIAIEHLQPSALGLTKASVELQGLHVSQGSRSIELEDLSSKEPIAPIVIEHDEVTVPELKLLLKASGGLSVAMSAQGKVSDVSTNPILDATLGIAPFDLAKLKGNVDGVDRIAGTLSGGLAVKGPIRAPHVSGEVKLRDGALALTGIPLPLDDVLVDIAVDNGEVRLVRASANVGSGTIDATGSAPLVGLSIGTATANITARNIKVPVGDGIDMTAGADLVATYKPDPLGGRTLPNIQGTVSVAAFAYTRPIALNLNLSELSKSLKRTEVESYDPSNDVIAFDLNLVSPKPLRVENDLVAMKLEVGDNGIEISGTNQRYGARGSLRILPESKIRLRDHEFDVHEGFVRFDDPTKIRADVDVRAVTEFRRATSASGDAAGPATAAAGTGASTGQWDISIRAHGPTEDLKFDLTSDPPLDQEDIVLLLTLGMTRAELDRGLAGSLGETVGLQALSTLTGADKAVQTVVPIIDYFQFGSAYSPNTGKTEPNVTVGKRLTDKVNASVTTSLTQREVGATLELHVRKGMSIQASYDNTSQVNTTIGNLGADLRWHLEFE